jgi:quercetin dioxygenase-like cupin family protein
MGIVRSGPLAAMVGDPDDHRPSTTWRLAVDPGTGGRVAELSFLEERCAVGDRIPSHRHDVDEVVVVIDGEGSYELAGEVHDVGSGDVIFIPAGTEHGTVNTGDEALHVHAVFPARKVLMEMLDRNPAPGTEADQPMTTRYDFATGEFEVLGPTNRKSP